MDKQSTGIITLLRSALTGASLTLPQDFDWEQGRPTIFQHHLDGLAIRGAMGCGISRTNPGIPPLMSVFCQQIATHRKQMQELQAVYDLFDEHGIDYLPIKGAVLKSLYPQGELRTMGDADILIKVDQYPSIQQLLPKLGMQYQGRTDHHFEWQGENLSLELHIYLMLTRDPFWFSYYTDIWEKAIPVGDGRQYRLSEEDHFIFLIAHFARHFRNGSVNAKNMCDFWLYRQAYPNMNESYIREELEKLHMLEFYQKILKVLQVWFEGAPADHTDEQLTRIIFNGGILDEEKSLAALDMLRNQSGEHAGLRGKLRTLRTRLFPPLSQMSCRYAFLEKYPFLLPVTWFLRFIMIIGRPEYMRRNINIAKNIYADTDDLASQLEEGLDIAGLEIN